MAATRFSENDELRLRALVVDDHEANRMLLKALLPPLGCAVSCAESGEEAVELAHRAAFDLVIIDLHMAGIDGDEATRLLRASGPSRLAFVAQWSTDPMGRLDHGLYDDALSKPLRIVELHTIVAEARRRALGREDAAPRPGRFQHRRAT